MPEERREEQGQSFLRTALQSVGLFLLMQFAAKQIFGIGSSSTAKTPGADVSTADFAARPSSLDPGVQYHGIPQTITPMWSPGTELDLSIYVSPSMIMPPLKSMPAESLVLEEKAFEFGGWKDKREIDTIIKVPKEVQNNGTLWAHFYIAKTGQQIDPTAPDYETSAAYHFARPLTQYLAKKKVKKTRNLLSNSAEDVEDEDEAVSAGPTFVSYYHPNFTMSFIPDSGVQKFPAMHPAVRSFVQLERTGARDSTGQNGWYYPILFVNTFWQLRDQMTELNNTVTTLPLHITLKNQPNWQFSLIASVDMGMKETARNAANNQGQMTSSGDGSEFEEFKRILLSSNPYLLATTGIVSVLHMIFEMLAFKNDVSHWRNKKDNIGTSVRTILANVFMQTVIFLYLMDNNESTSWMILFGQGMGILVEAWKVTKAVNVRIRPSAPGSLIPYSIVFEDKHPLSDTEKKTQEYDEIAFKYLYLVAIPLLLAYAGYSLMYETHKSWYSFIIAVLVGSVYAYGFLMMVPSLYINYRLKSVAHMPAKAMTYKFLNTFIDDLFAFTIKMPTLHRLATLRDDLIFFVYLYQSWKYKVDYTRVNEFGQGGDEEEDKDKLAAKPLTSPPTADESVGEAVEAVKTAEKEGSVKASGAEKKKNEGRKRK
ncbi:cleft lip and palate associated transmembrane protein 1 [Saccharata proteae CBS 121410]|uniref:Cleft lip and palate associated transmembrane protein 1 n=1 Tax=Saccharata proteae CBS 121410 TaxID=1314787 RepID=A0A9P4HSN6_9PEZI|nr:cleft lip and palate associated transmembrane protein 1 [Saccharata proteae CBS 121410]